MSEFCKVPGCVNGAAIRGVCVLCFNKHRDGDTSIKQYIETDPAKIRDGRHGKSICPVPGCDLPVKTRGLCNRHYVAAKTSPNSPTGREAKKFMKPSLKPRGTGSRTKKRTPKTKPTTPPRNIRQKPNADQSGRTEKNRVQQSSPHDNSVTLNVPAMATQLRNALTIATGAPPAMCKLQGGFVFITSDPADTTRVKLLYLSGEGIVRPAKIEIE